MSSILSPFLMDSSTLPEDFLTKQQVAEAFGCSDRTVQRDISKLLKVKDDALSFLRLATDDGEVRLGSDVTVEVIEKLNHDGLKPRWYVDKEWAEQKYGQHAEPPQTPPPRQTHEVEDERTRGPAGSASGDREVVTLLREQIKQLEKHNQQLSQQLDNRSEREKETNILIRDLHTLMAEMQNRLLPARTETGSRSESARQWSNVETQPATEEKQRVTHDTVDAPTDTNPSEDKVEKGSPRSHSATRPATKKSSPSRTPGRRSATRKATKTTTKKKPASKEPTTTAKYLPTFHKLYRSLRDRS